MFGVLTLIKKQKKQGICQNKQTRQQVKKSPGGP